MAAKPRALPWASIRRRFQRRKTGIQLIHILADLIESPFDCFSQWHADMNEIASNQTSVVRIFPGNKT